VYLAAPTCPNCDGEVLPEDVAGRMQWSCEACDLIILDTPATASMDAPDAGSPS
jgi:hypothetical protein